MNKDRLEAIVKEMLAEPEKFKKDSVVYLNEILPYVVLPNEKEQKLEAEEQLIGMMYLDPEKAPAILHYLEPKNFRGAKTRKVFQAAQKVYDKEGIVDLVSSMQVLGKDYAKFLVKCIDATPTSVNPEHLMDAMGVVEKEEPKKVSAKKTPIVKEKAPAKKKVAGKKKKKK